MCQKSESFSEVYGNIHGLMNHLGIPMNRPSTVDEQRFRKLLGRNVTLPLGVGVITAVFFIGLISYLLSVIQWVEHTDRVINNTNRALKLSIDMETGMRGFLLSGDDDDPPAAGDTTAVVDNTVAPQTTEATETTLATETTEATDSVSCLEERESPSVSRLNHPFFSLMAAV